MKQLHHSDALKKKTLFYFVCGSFLKYVLAEQIEGYKYCLC